MDWNSPLLRNSLMMSRFWSRKKMRSSRPVASQSLAGAGRARETAGVHGAPRGRGPPPAEGQAPGRAARLRHEGLDRGDVLCVGPRAFVVLDELVLVAVDALQPLLVADALREPLRRDDALFLGGHDSSSLACKCAVVPGAG